MKSCTCFYQGTTALVWSHQWSRFPPTQRHHGRAWWNSWATGHRTQICKQTATRQVTKFLRRVLSRESCIDCPRTKNQFIGVARIGAMRAKTGTSHRRRQPLAEEGHGPLAQKLFHFDYWCHQKSGLSYHPAPWNLKNGWEPSPGTVLWKNSCLRPCYESLKNYKI